MPSSDGYIFKAGTPSTSVALIDAVLEFESRREARTVVHEIPAGGVSVVVRPHSPRTGTFRLLFTGTNAQSRAEAVEASLATGARHFLNVGTTIPATWYWTTTGNLVLERVQDLHGKGWVVSADWTETP